MASEKSTPVIIPATQAHRKFGDLIRRVYSGKEHFVVEKDGLPVAAIISVQEYEALMEERDQWEQDRQARLKQFQETARAMGEEIARLGLTEEEVMAALEKTKAEVYQDYYGSNRAK